MPVSDSPISISIVIPAYNEGRRLPDTLSALAAFLETTGWSWDLVVVDDGSADGTAELAEQVARREPRVRVLREPHRGKGAAVKAGMLAATGGYRFLCDADLSMPARELPRFLPPILIGADVAIGSREGPGARRVGEPWRRHATGRVFNWAIRALVLDAGASWPWSSDDARIAAQGVMGDARDASAEQGRAIIERVVAAAEPILKEFRATSRG
jgi:glycosyltransferase involved in cell wall biosynthesis